MQKYHKEGIVINKKILAEIIITTTSLSMLLSSIILCLLLELSLEINLLIILPFLFIFIISVLIGLRLEQKAGPYKCSKCGRIYKINYKRILISPHIGFTRYIKCPNCKEKS